MKIKSFKLIYVLFVIIITIIVVQAQEDSAGTEKSKLRKFWGSYELAGGYGGGFKVVDSEKGTLNIKIMTYLRYLNQKMLDPAYVTGFGDTIPLDRRQDIQLNKVNITFTGWLFSPKFRYLLFVWTSNGAQGQGAQVAVAGKLNYAFNKHLMLGGGVDALPGTRTTEANFPFWHTVDNRLTADEYFRASFAMGVWARGEIVKNFYYHCMVANNMSTLGIDAGQLDNIMGTYAMGLSYFPTGDYGLNSSFGDFEDHQKAATRFAAHFLYSKEDFQSQPNTDAFDNVQIRLSDGSPIFKPNLFAPGAQVEQVVDKMTSFDTGVKYQGFEFSGEYFLRWLNNLEGRKMDSLNLGTFFDHGFQLQASSMLVPQLLQFYVGGSQVYGDYGNPWEVRTGLNLFPFKNQIIRLNVEYIYMHKSPVGGLSYPYAVGGTGSIFDFNLLLSF